MAFDGATRDMGQTVIDGFYQSLLAQEDPLLAVKAGLVGQDVMVEGPNGPHKMIYADYVASGRAVTQVEEFIMTKVLPYYGNTHTETSYTGRYMSGLREAARRQIGVLCNAPEDTYAVIFAGSGATTGLNQLVHLWGVADAARAGEDPLVIVGPYEHHSNLLAWRESGAEVVEIHQSPAGGPSLSHLQSVVEAAQHRPIFAAFSAMANVTGLCTDPRPVTRIIKDAGGKIVWDFAGGGPYIDVDMTPEKDVAFDAVVLSPHKYVGGPGASGVLIVKRESVVATTPARPGGGTVRFVNAKTHDYVTRLEGREEGGTPNVIGDIRACLALLVKAAIGVDRIKARHAALAARAFEVWGDVPALYILDPKKTTRVPILSFTVQTADEVFDYQSFTRDLSDLYGIQARGGCSCAGPYVHHLLAIDDGQSERLRQELAAGDDRHKPGFVRLNLSYLAADAEVEYILHSVAELAQAYCAVHTKA